MKKAQVLVATLGFMSFECVVDGKCEVDVLTHTLQTVGPL
ncbi:hypothetical protein Rcae01_02034 [Novipirellula caenicola]|uniref:Uncharacterized protein n=1 Tax=Novipirellula caenicola TaxID=1536901 RepID=A0ABP9VN17_9BACT